MTRQARVPGGTPAALADRLHAASIRLLRRLRAVDREGALGPARLSALSVIVFAGPLTLGQLAQAEHVRPATTSRLVRGLERLGLARRRPDPGDGRVAWIEATGAGRRLLDRGRRRRLAVLEPRIAALAPADRAVLEQAIEILARLARDEG
ncbi:MAG TPA: MarR family transcriptional regulator [Candidatus Eisenbacteria bacterium]|jgi:DNA-binding MarR family transcriptional regulator